MLSSITPLGERGRNNRFGFTAAFFVAGSVLGGTALGVVAGGVGELLVPVHPAIDAGVVAVGALVGAALDARIGPLRLPTITRQVDERWLHRYRSWVYGLGFGVQLGAALTTIVSSAAVYLMVVATVLTRSALAGAIVGGVFGLVRGASVLLARSVHSPSELRTFHRRLAAASASSERIGVATQGLIGVAGVAAMVVVR